MVDCYVLSVRYERAIGRFGSFAAIADCPENAGFSCERHNELWDIARKLFILSTE